MFALFVFCRGFRLGYCPEKMWFNIRKKRIAISGYKKTEFSIENLVRRCRPRPAGKKFDCRLQGNRKPAKKTGKNLFGCYIGIVMDNKGKGPLKKSFWKNPAVLIGAGALLLLSAYFYIQKGGESAPPVLTPSDFNPAVTTNPAFSTNPSSASTGTTPKPYEYNAATNQYWDPGHRHWHQGPPPPPESQKVLSANPVTPPAGLPPGTPTPKPYEYNPVTNQYWDPGHNHWHNGPPPGTDTTKK